MTATIKKVWQWLVYSSDNADQISTTLKGFGITAIPVIISISNVAHIAIGGADLTAFYAAIVSIVYYALLVVGGIVTLYGAARKIVLSVIGSNSVTMAQKNGAM